MKAALLLTLFVSFSASADSFFSGSSDVKTEKNSVVDSGPYMTGSSETRDNTRAVASQKNEKKELSMENDAYFTGSSLK